MTTSRHSLGKLAYETYMNTLLTNGAATLYFAWETLHHTQQDGWQKAAEAVWSPAFEAGADSVGVVPNAIS